MDIHNSDDCMLPDNALTLTDKIVDFLIANGLWPEAISERDIGVEALIYDIIAEHLE